MKRKLSGVYFPRAVFPSLTALVVALGALPVTQARMVVSDDGVSSSGPGSMDEISRMTFENNTDGIYVLQVSDSADLTAEDLVLSSTGSGGGGAYVNTGGNLKGQRLTITVGEEGSAGILIESSSSATLSDVAIDVQGTTTGLLLDGDSDTSRVYVVMSDSTVSAEDGSAILARYGDLTLNNVEASTSGAMAHGVDVQLATVNISDSTITVTGAGASGIAVSGSSSTLASSVTLDNVTLSSDSAAAISVSPTSVALTINDSTLTGGSGELLDVASGGGTEYSTVTLAASNSQLNGAITVDDAGNTVSVSLLSGSTLNGGVTSVTSLSLDGTSTWNMDSSSSVGQLTNNGTINFSDSAIVDVLTVNGNYQGNGGLLVMNTVLGDDSSATHKLIVTGDVEAGTTRVSVNNLGGEGAETVEGIEIVSVGGTSYGSFVKSGRIVAGAYDYDLTQKGESWYLTSYISALASDTASRVGNERPEAGSYIANLAAANTMFTMRLHDRQGETRFVDALSGEKKVTSLWLRQVGGHNRWRDDTGGLSTQSNRYMVQLGGDIARWGDNDGQRMHLGVMGGYANNQSRTHSSRYASRGKVEGYSVGMYATWLADSPEQSGAYADSWLLYNWFDNTVKGDSLATESYTSTGFSASLEVGYALKLSEPGGSDVTGWFIQPQAQVTWMGVEANHHTEQNGTRIGGKGDGNLQTRLGLRTYLQGHSAIDSGKSRLFQPFVEANWVHNTRRFGVQMDDIALSQNGARNLAELKTGVEGQISPRLNLWGNVGVQVGDNGYNDAAAVLGVKYHF